MKRALVLLLLLALAMLAVLPGCVFDGSGRIETRTFDLADFDSIETNMVVTVDVIRSDGFAVSVAADDNLWSRLEVSKRDKTLKMELPSSTFYSNVTVHAVVMMPALANVHTSGSSYARFTGFDNTASLALHGSGSSTIEGDGKVEKLSVDMSGSSRANLPGVKSGAASVELSGGSNASLGVERTLDYDLSGGSHLVYFGNPQIGKRETSGGSSAERR